MLTIFNSLSGNLTVTIAGNFSHDIYLGYQVIDWTNHSTFVFSHFTIRGKYCALELPSIFSTQTTWSFVVPFDELVEINFGDGHAGNCTFESIVTGFDNHKFITTTKTPGLNVTDLLSLDLSGRELEETIHLEYTIVPTEFLIPEPITQTITIQLFETPIDPGPPCTPNLVLLSSSVKQSYTFTQGDEPVVIDLTGHIANNDCKY